jgi:hypothetical protein
MTIVSSTYSRDLPISGQYLSSRFRISRDPLQDRRYVSPTTLGLRFEPIQANTHGLGYMDMGSVQTVRPVAAALGMLNVDFL